MDARAHEVNDFDDVNDMDAPPWRSRLEHDVRAHDVNDFDDINDFDDVNDWITFQARALRFVPCLACGFFFASAFSNLSRREISSSSALAEPCSFSTSLASFSSLLSASIAITASLGVGSGSVPAILPCAFGVEEPFGLELDAAASDDLNDVDDVNEFAPDAALLASSRFVVMMVLAITRPVRGMKVYVRNGGSSRWRGGASMMVPGCSRT